VRALVPGRGSRRALELAVGLLVCAVADRRRGGEQGREREPDEHQALAAIGAGLSAADTIDAHWLGAAYERALDELASAGGERRRSRGVFYTPAPLVRYLLGHTLGPLLARPGSSGRGELPRVLDPACGCGAFLVEAARWLRARRPEMESAEIASRLCGVDLDPLAATLCRLGLWLELCSPGEPLGPFEESVRVGDSLLAEPHAGSFDAVIGNPPFLSQLAATTARTAEASMKLRERFGGSVRAYTDPAALFLQLASERVRVGGRVGLVLPVSVLGSRDAAGVRSRAAELGALRALWLDSDGMFDAGVRTIAIAFERGAAPGAVVRHCGSGFDGASVVDAPPAGGGSWGPLAADLAGVPRLAIERAGGVLGEIAVITAGFRDEYYAVTAALREAGEPGAPGELPVATVGMIEPAGLRWGARPVKLGARSWRRPVVEMERAGDELRRLAAQQLRPKLLVATQSRAIEVAADPEGAFVAVTPVVLAFPRAPSALWRVGAVIASPVVAAWAGAQAFGTARSLGAIKPSAALLRAAPLPYDDALLGEAAAQFRQLCESAGDPSAGAWREFGDTIARAYGISDAELADVLEWWLERVCREPG